MKNKQPKFSSNSDVKMSCTTKKRLEGTSLNLKMIVVVKKIKIKNTLINLSKN